MPRAKAEAEDKVPVQFRVGTKLLEKVDRAVEASGLSRTAWVADAVNELLETGKALPLRVTAAELLANKYTLMVRLDAFLVAMVDELCGEREMPRTVWLLDACMTKLRKNGEGKRRG